MRLLVLLIALTRLANGGAECDRFIPQPADRSPLAFSNALSYLSCTKDASIPRIQTVDDIDPVMDDLLERFTPTVTLYLELMRVAPESMQLRIGFAVGLAYEELVVRARTAIVDPRDPGLRAALERRIESYLAGAIEIFDAIDRVTATDTTLCLTAIDHDNVVRARRLRDELSASRTPR